MTTPVVPQSPVTILDVFTKQVEMGGQLSVIHEQLKAIPDHETRVRGLESKQVHDAENRLRILEAARNRTIGACMMISAVVGGGGGWLAAILSRH